MASDDALLRIVHSCLPKKLYTTGRLSYDNGVKYLLSKKTGGVFCDVAWMRILFDSYRVQIKVLYHPKPRYKTVVDLNDPESIDVLKKFLKRICGN